MPCFENETQFVMEVPDINTELKCSVATCKLKCSVAIRKLTCSVAICKFISQVLLYVSGTHEYKNKNTYSHMQARVHSHNIYYLHTYSLHAAESFLRS